MWSGVELDNKYRLITFRNKKHQISISDGISRHVIYYLEDVLEVSINFSILILRFQELDPLFCQISNCLATKNNPKML